MSLEINNIIADSLSSSTLSATTVFLGGNMISSSNSSFSSLSATTLSGGTIYSGSTDLSFIFASIIDGSNDITRVQPGTNTYTGGTGNFPTVNVSALTIDNIVVSGASRFSSLSATTLSGGTIYSGSTDLSFIFATSVSASATKLDMQSVSTGNTVTTTTALIDVGAMTLTTKNLGSSATTYQVYFDTQLSNNNNAGSSSIKAFKNGVEINGSLRTVTNAGASLNAANRSVSTSCVTTGVTSGDVIKIQFSAATGTVTLTNRTLSIIGILNSNMA
jgi:hypothetical protein